MLSSNEEATDYVLYEIQQALLTMSRVAFEYLNHSFLPQALVPFKVQTLKRFPEQLLQMASESIVFVNDVQRNIFNEIVSVIIHVNSTDQLDA